MILTPSIFIYICKICREILTLIQTYRQTYRQADRVTYRDTSCLKNSLCWKRGIILRDYIPVVLDWAGGVRV